MDMDMNQIAKVLSEQIGESRVLFSEEAETGAADLAERIRTNDIYMEILPNNYSQFTGELEERDFLSFAGFVNSLYGKKVIKMLEDQNEGQLA